MVKEFDAPIKCPKCGRKIENVQMEKLVVLYHDAESQRFEDNGQGGVTVRCYYCNSEIGGSDANGSWGVFPKWEGLPLFG